MRGVVKIFMCLPNCLGKHFFIKSVISGNHILVGQMIVEAHFHSDSSCFALHSSQAYLSKL